MEDYLSNLRKIREHIELGIHYRLGSSVFVHINPTPTTIEYHRSYHLNGRITNSTKILSEDSKEYELAEIILMEIKI